MTYRIVTLEITDYKRVRKVAITPAADASIILIAGKNGQGKSSTLDALTAAFGGKRATAADPVRHGADEAAIYVELANGAGKLTIDRVIAPDGTTTLEVRDADGAIKAPQAMLDKLIGARFLDPLAFLGLPSKEQRAQLMRLIPGAARIDELNAKRERAFTRRTELGRDLKAAQGELVRLPAMDVATPIDVAQLVAAKGELANQMRAGDGLANAHKLAMRATSDAIGARDRNAQVSAVVERRIADLETQLACERAELEKVNASMDLGTAIQAAQDAETAAKVKLDAAVKGWSEGQPARDKIDADIARAADHNRAIHAAEAQNARRLEAKAAVEKHEAETKELSTILATIEARKAETLAAAKLPVDGLAVSDDGITLNGVPFAQASGAERLRVSLALAMKGSPELDDVWVHDGALLDDESLAIVADQVVAAGKRLWLERVGTKDPGVIVIQDGQVAS